MTLPAIITHEYPEPIRLPDVRRPEQTPCWPAWVASRIDVVRTEERFDETLGRWSLTPTLPMHLLLETNEREALERYIADIDRLCGRTPIVAPDAERETLEVLTRMMITLPSAAQSDIGAEVRGEAFLEALDDLPPWAVRGAVRRWNRGECGLNERGEAYDTHWCPAPAELRRVALAELNRVRMPAYQAQLLLRAEAREEYSDEHCRKMRERIAKLFQNIGAPLVGSNGSGGEIGAS